MKRSSRLPQLLVLASALTAAAATLLGAPTVAEACSIACAGGKPVFADKLLPSGVAGLVMPLHSSGGEPDLKLNGVAVPARYEFVDGVRALVPATSLGDGAYSFSYVDSCSGGNQKAEFSVGAAVPAPEKTGSVNVLTRFVAGVKNQPEEGGPVDSRCGETARSPLSYDHVDVTVTFVPANELKSYLPAMRFVSKTTGPGPGASSSFTVDPASRDGVSIATLSVACNPSASPTANRQGIYTIDVAGKLLGGETLPSSTTSIDVTCPAGAGTDDAPPPALGLAIDAPSQTSGGCTITAPRNSPPSTYTAIGASLLALALLSRRRR